MTMGEILQSQHYSAFYVDARDHVRPPRPRDQGRDNCTLNLCVIGGRFVNVWLAALLINLSGAYLGGVLGVLEHPPQPQAQY